MSSYDVTLDIQIYRLRQDAQSNMMGQNPGPWRGSAGRPRLHVEGDRGRKGVWCKGRGKMKNMMRGKDVNIAHAILTRTFVTS